MDVFVSWSKSVSQGVAHALHSWLPEVIQQLTPWMSSEDIDKGQRWSDAIATRLEATGQGLICVTPQNLNEPWLNFEAGALAKSMQSARVRPLVFGLGVADLVGPLAQFMAADITDKADMLKVMRSLNEATTAPLADIRLERAFDRTWPDFMASLDQLALPDESLPPSRTLEDKVDEIVNALRRLERRTAPPEEPPMAPKPASPIHDTDSLYRLRVQLQTGQLVRHPAFGLGRVLSERGDGNDYQVQVRFATDVGTKWLLLRYAPVTIVEEEPALPDAQASKQTWPDEPPF